MVSTIEFTGKLWFVPMLDGRNGIPEPAEVRAQDLLAELKIIVLH